MERSNFWNHNNPHSPTHRSPDLAPHALTEVIEENFVPGAGQRARNKFSVDSDESDPTIQPNKRLQDQRGPGVRPGHQYYQRDNNNNNNNRASDVSAVMFVGETVYESAESSVSSPMSSGKTPQFHEFEFARHGYRGDHGDDDETNSVATHTTTKEEYRTSVRSALSSLHYDSAWGSVWDEYQPDFKLLHDSYQSKKQDIFKDIEKTMEKLRMLEKNYERAKDGFHNRLSLDYKELCQGLVQKRNRIEKAKAEFEASANVGKDKATFPTDKVTLNVGGETHTTLLATLRKEPSSLLAVMFSGRHQLVPEDDGSYFVDRDPTHFRHVLNYLRDSRISPSAIQDPSVRHELLQEAKYYKIDSLVQYLQQQQ